ncbi:NADH-ubiquinone oxidoreductase 29.9 kDa subunit, mitochondrial [Golovinomyces cichoracearum]|uniref:NADH-ubiquinone oxidoreductase 29.9 kDa subunit, mitochondrial n=1 Tax=Golovinomyces cichoracearum TaxID=62708 RepID=A0A420HWN5_9PEZI|nr:NADH-ubiquinone oxidoreductase 29.9 kDa subunit, mitochondrial [Golovinomyces cichoracearum]
MQHTLRRLASTKTPRYLEVGSCTGLTGLFTHASPRSTLMYTYHSTLEALSKLPPTSLYRKSTEALTKHRMAIVEAVKPAGLEEYHKKVKDVIAANPWAFQDDDGDLRHVSRGGKQFLVVKPKPVRDDLTEEWDGKKQGALPLEGTRSEEERATESSIPDSEVLFKISKKIEALEGAAPGTPEAEVLAALWNSLPQKMENAINGKDKEPIELDPEPQLTADQIEEIENKIGAGLIEEVIQVAEGELKLVDTMLKAQVWEDLEQKPLEDQWTYFQR